MAGFTERQPRLRAGLMAISVVAIFIYYLGLAWTRRIDADEGFYLYAARLVGEGQLPYRDFFYPQMPLLPYVWHLLGGSVVEITWLLGRAVGAAVATGCAVLFAMALRRRIQSIVVFVLVMFIYLTSDLGLEYCVIVKTYCLAVVFLLGAWLCLQRLESGGLHGFLPAVAGGVLAGLALGVRLTVLPFLAVLPFVFLLAAGAAPRRWIYLSGYCLGILLTLLLIGVFWQAAPEAFVYNNWHYHQLIGAESWAARMRANVPFLLRQLLVPAWFISIVLIGWQTTAGTMRWRRQEWVLAAMVVCVILTAVTPHRSFAQYFCFATPWLLLLGAPAFQSFGIWLKSPRKRVWTGRLIVVGFMVVWIYGLHHTLVQHWPTWTLPSDRPEFIAEYDRRIGIPRYIGLELNRLGDPEQTLLTWWPGYALESKLRLVEGLENHFGRRVARYEAEDLVRELEILPEDELVAMIRNHEVDFIVTGIWTGIETGLGQDYYEELINEAGGYEPVVVIGGAKIYQLKRDAQAVPEL